MSIRYVPVVVRARLSAGIAHAAPWGIALDGILASEVWATRKAFHTAAAPRALEQENPPDLDLPLARCTPADGPWHWAATCAYPESLHRIDVHTWTGRLDHRHLEQTAVNLPKVVAARQGRYRTRRMPLLVSVCSSITWHAIGDPAAILELLTSIPSIGKKRSSGEGHVLAWEVTPAPALPQYVAAHLHPDGTLGRPTPTACIANTAPPNGGIARAGIRPPYMHRSRQHILHLPTLWQASP